MNSFSRAISKLISQRRNTAADKPDSSIVKRTYGKPEDNFDEGVSVAISKELAAKKLRPKPKNRLTRATDYTCDFSYREHKRIWNKHHKRKPSYLTANPFAEIFKEFPKIQLTVRNNSLSEKEIVLWGGNQEISVSAPTAVDVADHTISTRIALPDDVYPQGIVFNPANNLTYVASQLSGTVTAIDSEHRVVTTVHLDQSFPGSSSPTALAVNTNPDSREYGAVYVACSIADELAIIGLDFSVRYVTVDSRPTDVQYSSVTNLVYTSNYASQSVSTYNPESRAVEIAAMAPDTYPLALGINTANGDVYVSLPASNQVQVFDVTGIPVTTLDTGEYPARFAFVPTRNVMYVTCRENDKVNCINTLSRTVVATISVGSKPYNCFYNPSNGFLYVQNGGDNSISVINSSNTVVATLNLGNQGSGGAFNSYNNCIYISDTLNGQINVIGYLPVTSGVTISEDYNEIREDLKFNLGIVQHTRFVIVGDQRISHFKHNRFTPTGTTNSRFIPYEQFANPQNTLNVADLTALNGTLIDGKMNWTFKLPAEHSLSVIVWFRYFQVRDLISSPPQTTTKK